MTRFLARLFWQVLDRPACALTLARLSLLDLIYGAGAADGGG
jgi:hypothetical protein